MTNLPAVRDAEEFDVELKDGEVFNHRDCQNGVALDIRVSTGEHNNKLLFGVADLGLNGADLSVGEGLVHVLCGSEDVGTAGLVLNVFGFRIPNPVINREADFVGFLGNYVGQIEINDSVFDLTSVRKGKLVGGDHSFGSVSARASFEINGGVKGNLCETNCTSGD